MKTKVFVIFINYFYLYYVNISLKINSTIYFKRLTLICSIFEGKT